MTEVEQEKKFQILLAERMRGLARTGEVWRWPVDTCPITVLILGMPEEGGRDEHHDVYVLDMDPFSGWHAGKRGVNWTVSTGFGWERVV